MLAHFDVGGMARLERFQLPTRWFEARGKGVLESVEVCGYYLLLVEAVAADLLVFVELLGCRRQLRLRKRLQQREDGRATSSDDSND